MAIVDQESAQAWLEAKGRSEEEMIAFAARCALRTIPGIGTADTATMSVIALPVLRSILVAGVAATTPTTQVKGAAFFANSASFKASYSTSSGSAAYYAVAASASAASTAFSAPTFSASGAASASASCSTYAASPAAGSATYAATNLDAGRFEAQGHSQAFNTSLWPEPGVPAFLAAPLDILQAYWGQNDDVWGFWARWYEGMLNGTPMDWQLQAAVALIAPKIWADGPRAVSEEIRKLEVDWAHGKGAIEETLVLDHAELVYSAVVLKVSNANRLARHLSRVEDALEDILCLGGNNGITRGTADYLIIRRLVEKYADDPERIAFDLTDVNHSIERQKASQEYPDSEPIRLLQTAIIGCVTHIRSSYAEIDAELSQTYPRASELPSEEEAEVLQAALQFSAEMQDERTAQTTVEDEAELLYNRIIDAAKEGRPEGPVQVASEYRTIVLRRQLSRLSQIARDWVSIDGLAERYEAKHSKAAGYIGRMGGAAWVLTQAVLTLARMLGLR